MSPVCRSTSPKQLRHDFHSAKRRRRDQGSGTIFIACFEIGPMSNDFGHNFLITEHRRKMKRGLLLFIPTLKRGRIEQSFSHPFKAAHMDRFEDTGHGFDHFANFLWRVAHPFPRHHCFLLRVVLPDSNGGDDTTVVVDVEVDRFLGLLLHL